MGRDCHEYRFQGALGFGGKFRNNGRLYVDCYPEDETPARLAMIDRANARIKQLVIAWADGQGGETDGR